VDPTNALKIRRSTTFDNISRNTDPELWLDEWQAMREQLFGQWLIQMGQALGQGSGEAEGQ
jgi:hypothetical protein